MPNFINKSGQRHGMLVVLDSSRNTNGKIEWMCRCDCGIEKFILSSNIGRLSNSCGCQRLIARKTHGFTSPSYPHKIRFYGVWASMIQRCKNPNSEKYERYGGRGITVADEWLKFEGFESDMFSGYAPGLEIDRRENNLGYCKSNCRWVTRRENMNNTSACVLITHNNETLTMMEWSRRFNISHVTLRSRLMVSKWPIEKALTHPISRGRRTDLLCKIISFD